MRNSNKNSGLVEQLESRRLLSGALLSGGILRVFGDGASVNTITVANSLDGLSVDVTVNSVNSLGVPKTFTKSFAKTLGISQVYIRGGFKADTITVDQNNSDFTIATRVCSGAGDDVITTGSGNDIVFAGGGNDTIDTDDGMDWVRGMLGNDMIDSGGGNDRVNAGVGNDRVDAGGGADIVRGEFGDDYIEGGGGDDLIFGGVGNDTLLGDNGNDALWGGAGDDMLFGGDGNDTLGGFLGANVMRGEADQDTFVVRQLSLNPTNDYDSTIDILMPVNTFNEGGRPPAM